MSAVKVNNLNEVNATVLAWFGAVKAAAEEAAVGMAKVAFEQILKEGPQYSGDFVANTKVSFGTVDASFTPNALGWRREHRFGPANPAENLAFKRGDTPAIDYAMSRANWAGFKLGQPIFITSNAVHDSEPYAIKIETGQIAFRPVNEGADHVYRNAYNFVASRYGTIGFGELNQLRNFK